MRKIVALLLLSLLAGLAATLIGPSRAPAVTGVQHLHFEYGPIHLVPGQNIIQFSDSEVPKPTVPGWITGIAPNLIKLDGTVPPVDLIHLHHAVWLNLSRSDATKPGLPERFFASGEEKTRLILPGKFGYRFDPNDTWLLNYMLHVLDDNAWDVKLTYDLDFVPETPGGPVLRDVTPLWMDVQNGSIYPVFDVPAGSGTNGRYTYPNDASNPYGGGTPLNRYTLPSDGVLVATAGHLHPGGLHTDLKLTRTNAYGVKKSAHLFKSSAVYYEPAGPVSWDVSMTATPSTWRVHVKPGDVLSMSATYNTNNWSWYEVMGIMVVWFAPGTDGASAFKDGIDVPGQVTHGHLAENDNHGGDITGAYADPSALSSGPAVTAVDIANFKYAPGDLGGATVIPTVKAGQALTFTNLDAPSRYGYGTWHTITTCKLPCNRSTGIAYPIADAPLQLDSGQLGNYGAPTKGTVTWDTPTSLPTGDYAYFCRVHPFMRGAFRVVP
jgi:plastocyanin